jgi:protein-S-isoprenylcysteine O-methyltransferase Ste14
MISLLLRNLLFTLLQPGVVAVLVPYLILRSRGHELLPENWTVTHFVGGALIIAGGVILVTCILRFVTEGKGTISPLDPTKKLIVRGLYRYSRNPMYVGVMLILTGEALFWWSAALALYATVVFIAFNLFIILHEEPRLRRVFGPEYESYLREVRRWI